MGEKLLVEEEKIWGMGYELVGGIDEAGRGPLAGPVVAACVVFPPGFYIDGVRDSKKLSEKRREEIYEVIMENAVTVGIGRIGPERIDRVNILNATYEAMEQALMNCSTAPDYLLIDALRLSNCIIPQSPLIKGDARSHSIAAASIIAKVTRDREMRHWSLIYPEYQFDRHKGYGTKLHIEAIRTNGLCPIHRRSFTKRLVDQEKIFA